MTPFYWAIRATVKCLSSLLHRHRSYGVKGLPKGGAILAANHASHLDPCLIGISAKEGIHYLARQTLFDPPFLNWLIRKLNAHPISREGADLSSIKMIVGLLQEGDKVVIFPEGTRTRDGGLQPAEGGVAMLSMRSGTPIIPIYIHGTYGVWGRSRKRPKLLGKTACIFGRPIYPKEYAALPKKEAQKLVTDRMMRAIDALHKWYLAGAKGPLPES